MIQIPIRRRKSTYIKFIGGAVGASIIAFAAIIAQGKLAPVNAANESIVAGSSVTGRVNEQIPITNISISGTGNDTVPVHLTVDDGTIYVNTTTGLTFTGAQYGSSISFSGTRTNVNAALATLHYAGTTTGAKSLTVSLADSNTIYNPTTGHVYQYVAGDITWNDAFSAAASSTYKGAPGYLATITSQQENDFIKDRLNGDAWLGGSDAAVEGTWRWTGGPEMGENFYTGEGSDGTGGGAAVGGAFTNWAGPDTEPNNAGGNENCMETYISNGTWNDLPCDANVGGYVVEYGDDTHTLSGIPTATETITVAAATFAGGTGTVNDPYQITDCERLQDINQDLTANYTLTKDIDCTDTPNWNGGQGFVPIGNMNDGSFTGIFDGGYYTIDGLTEIRADDDSTTDYSSDPTTNQEYVGLFGYANGATMMDVNLTHAKIKGYQYVGGVVGFMINGTVSGATVNAGLDESSDTSCTPGYCVWARYGNFGGGIVGWMYGGSLNTSTVGGLVKGSGNHIGGLVGHMEGGAAIFASTSTADIDGGYSIGGAVGDMYDLSSLYLVEATGNVISKIDDEVGKPGWYAGGLVGQASNVNISQSYATGNVHADAFYAGGLGGYVSGSTINDAYATGNVSAGSDPAGGLIGGASFNTISRAYASGSVTGSDNTGALLGASFQDAVNDSFAVGHVAGSGAAGSLVGNWGGASVSQFYYDVTATGIDADHCDVNGTISGCIPLNANGLDADYFNDYRNAPFTQNGTFMWNVNDTWYFNGSSLPVLRMGPRILNNSSLPPVNDHDGISTAIENAAPNNGDGNDDGIADSTQANVVSFVNPVTNKYVTLQVDNACTITAASSAASPTNGDATYTYPFGLMNYTVDCGTAGFSTNVTIYYHGVTNASGMSVRKYNATTNTYSDLSSAVVTGTNPVKITYTLFDGGSLDEDGTANGIIIDPVGLASQITNASVTTPLLTSPTTLAAGVPNTGIQTVNFAAEIIFGIVGMAAIIFGSIWLFGRTPLRK